MTSDDRPVETAEGTEDRPGTGLRLFGVIRMRRGAIVEHRGRVPGLEEIGYRDLAAVLRTEAFVLPEPTAEALREHHRLVDLVMQETAVLPAPFGLLFRNEAGLRRFLAARYVELEDALTLVKAHWELRLTLRIRDGRTTREVARSAADLYRDLVAMARMGVPFARVEDDVVAAAFLVPREEWIRFLEEAEARAARLPEVSGEVSGPWPPYDFVRIRARSS